MEITLEENREIFRKAGRGLFIHWGLYSIPAGEWRGRKMPWFGEWIMHSAQIPRKEYGQLASQFNPLKYNARDWVKQAKDAGMEYIVFTSKHHDGFAMFKSSVDKFNIVEATPFKRDTLEELAEACRDSKMPLGIYYSQAMDWNEPGAGNALIDRGYGNNWDFLPGTPKEFGDYMDRKALPQIRELLTQYGPVFMMWFDNPLPSFTHAHAAKTKDLVRSIQPGCLISNRIGHGLGDIGGWGDNHVPEEHSTKLAEACVTMNETWGYKKDGGRWKTPEEIKQVIERGRANSCNVLLNVGPMANGEFPIEAKKILRDLKVPRRRFYLFQ